MTAMTQTHKEYAAALFMLASECGERRPYYTALLLAKDAICGEEAYMELLASPSIPVSERLSALEEAFSAVLPEHVLSFLQLLCERGRIRTLADCTDEYKRLLDASERVSVAYVVSAVPLTEEEKAAIRAKLEKTNGHSVTLECSVDEKLLGGLRIEMDGKVLDHSLRHRLQEVKDVISK